MVLLLVAVYATFQLPVVKNALNGEPQVQPEQHVTSETTSTETAPALNLPSNSATVVTEAVDSLATSGVATVSDNASTATVVDKPVVIVPDTVVIENELMALTIAGDGARITSAVMKNYTIASEIDTTEPLVELILDADAGIAGTSIGGSSLNSVNFTFSDSMDGVYTFTGSLQGTPVYKRFSFKNIEDSASYLVNVQVESELLALNSSSFEIGSGISESESEDGMSTRTSPRQVSIYNDGKLSKKSFGKPTTETESGRYEWVSLNSKYFAIATLPSSLAGSDLTIVSSPIAQYEKVSKENMGYAVSLTTTGNSTRSSYDLYLGPTQISELKRLDASLEESVFRGYAWFLGAHKWFPQLAMFVLGLINWFAGVFGDYGIAVILITLILRLITFPLTQSSMKSMSKMRDIQPKMQALQAKYKDNPQMLQAKMIEFYKEEGVNPLAGLGGCLPMFAQMPIMISLFVVLRKAVEIRGETTFLLPWVSDLSQKEALFNLPFTIPLPMDASIDTFALLPFAMAILMFFQNKKSMGTQDPNQKMMMYMMPVMMFFMFYNMPAALTLYFTFSSVLHLVQQKFVDRKKKGEESSVTVVKK